MTSTTSVIEVSSRQRASSLGGIAACSSGERAPISGRVSRMARIPSRSAPHRSAVGASPTCTTSRGWQPASPAACRKGIGSGFAAPAPPAVTEKSKSAPSERSTSQLPLVIAPTASPAARSRSIAGRTSAKRWAATSERTSRNASIAASTPAASSPCAAAAAASARRRSSVRSCASIGWRSRIGAIAAASACRSASPAAWLLGRCVRIASSSAVCAARIGGITGHSVSSRSSVTHLRPPPPPPRSHRPYGAANRAISAVWHAASCAVAIALVAYPVSITKSARLRFSASGSCCETMNSNFSAVIPPRRSTRSRCVSAGAETTTTASHVSRSSASLACVS
mmetsp:Transcript_10302/g.25549  ORF Transcript_10302/g.25549 Transcript_10302/m.25549 type:complete len:339 (-) Transcript_10302:76-1092(-)